MMTINGHIDQVGQFRRAPHQTSVLYYNWLHHRLLHRQMTDPNPNHLMLKVRWTCNEPSVIVG